MEVVVAELDALADGDGSSSAGGEAHHGACLERADDAGAAGVEGGGKTSVSGLASAFSEEAEAEGDLGAVIKEEEAAAGEGEGANLDLGSDLDLDAHAKQRSLSRVVGRAKGLVRNLIVHRRGPVRVHVQQTVSTSLSVVWLLHAYGGGGSPWRLVNTRLRPC